MKNEFYYTYYNIYLSMWFIKFINFQLLFTCFYEKEIIFLNIMIFNVYYLSNNLRSNGI